MRNEKMKNNILKFGLIAGSIIVLIPLLSGFIIGYGPDAYKMGEIIGYSTMLLSLLMIFFAVKEYKEKYPSVQLGFLKVFSIGAGISLIAGIMFGIYNLIHVTYIDPEFMSNYYEYYINNIRNSGAPAAQIEMQISQLEQEKELFMNPIVSFLTMTVTVFMIGLIISTVSGLFQSSKNKQIEAA